MIAFRNLMLHDFRYQSVLWLLASSAILIGSNDAPCGVGSKFKLPMSKRVKNGIIAEVDTSWVDGFGNRPIRIRLTTRKANRDRTLVIHTLPESYSSAYAPLRIETKVEIPQGEKEVVKTLVIPQNVYWNWLRLEFFEDGKKLNDLSMKHGFNLQRGYYNSGADSCVLIVDSDAPRLEEDRNAVIKDLRAAARKKKSELTPLLPNIETISLMAANSGNYSELDRTERMDRYRDVDSLSIIQNVPNFELIPPTDLPETYLGLGSVDIIVMSLVDLKNLESESPSRLEAIDAFVRNGGSLILHGESETAESRDIFGQSHRWTESDAEAFYRSPTRRRYSVDDETSTRRTMSLRAQLQSFPKFQIARHGFGRLIISSASDPFTLAPIYWQFMTDAIGHNRLTWLERHGIALNSDNADFWDFLIPGYGATPVVSFLSVITLFVVCIGPINFFVLRRIKRFYLLPFTVVLAALITTGVMLTYAFLSDGVERRVRLRSFTHLDQRSDGSLIAATHCRHAFLAAVVPRDGIVFPERTHAYPIVAKYHHAARRSQRTQAKQQLRSFHQGYLGSRSTSQFLTTDVCPTEEHLAVTETATEGLQAKNLLSVEIAHAWVIDRNGAIHYGKRCVPGEKLQLEPIPSKEARLALKKILLDYRPKPPEGLDNANASAFGNFSYASKSAYTRGSLLNTEMDDCAELMLKSPPRTYIAITHNAPGFLDKGIDGKEEAGFHVVRGGWSP